MKVLFVGDEQPYSAYALKEAARLAMNTWADVTLLGVQPGGVASEPAAPALNLALHSYRETFLNSWEGEGSPYAMTNWQYEWFPVRDGLLEEKLFCRSSKKDLQVRLRMGQVAASILTEAKEEGCDLIVLGCTRGGACQWIGSPGVPQKVANDADCSVLLVKEEQPISRILACLDQTHVSQSSLEILNQMVTLHQAQLEVIGLNSESGLKKQVYTRLIEVGDYYQERGIKVTTRITDIADFETFISRETQQDLLALWLGKKSLLQRFFPRDWVGRLVAKSQRSVLIMR